MPHRLSSPMDVMMKWSPANIVVDQDYDEARDHAIDWTGRA